ncbi:thiamine pyrophosphate-binding protein [Rhodobacteraceae bacterium NNCM2]|nr:thiamine pyrophosphate-binding protein [Coraliihabitans acroporae]
MNAADIIAQRLYAAGVRHAFGIPGGEVLTLIDALERAGILFILAKHENAAGFMAEGAWHATGAPAVLVATVGPGVANAFNVVANAEQDRVPLIVLSGMVDPAEALTYTHQVFDHGAAFARVCKASFVAPDGAIDVLADKAIRIAMSPRKGPVHIDVPIAIASADQPAPRPPRIAVEGPTAPSGPGFAAAKAAFQAAKRPVIMAGLDVLEEPGGPAAVRTFAEAHGIPVVTTYKAKGILPEGHPLSLGGHGLSPKADAIILPVFDEADCILSLGYDPIEMRTGWRELWDPAKVIEFAHAPNTHDMHFADAAWVCSITGGIEALGAPAAVDWGDRPGAIRAALLDAISPAGDWGPDHAMAEITRVLPENALSTVDSGAHRILLSQHFFCQQPRALVQSTGLCTMGCALPLAIGHKIAAPSRPAVCFIGDGCLEMTIGELATLRDSGLPVVIVVFVDSSLALIELKQRRSGMQNAGVDFIRTDFAALARLYGGEAVTITGPGEAGEAMAKALASERFTLIEVVIPRRAYDGLI